MKKDGIIAMLAAAAIYCGMLALVESHNNAYYKEYYDKAEKFIDYIYEYDQNTFLDVHTEVDSYDEYCQACKKLW